MSEALARRVRAAAAAGWWTLLIFAVWLVIARLIVLWLMTAEPKWVLALCGGEPITWQTLKPMYLWFFGAMKVLLLGALAVVVWLTLWSRRLRRIED